MKLQARYDGALNESELNGHLNQHITRNP